MIRRSAPIVSLACVLLVCLVSNSATGDQIIGQQLRIKRDIIGDFNYNKDLNDKNENIEERESIQGNDRLNSAAASESVSLLANDEDTLAKTSLGNRYRSKRSVSNVPLVRMRKTFDDGATHEDVERKEIPGNLFPETVIHSVELTSDKVKNDMLERKSTIPEGYSRDSSPTRNQRDLDKELPTLAQNYKILRSELLQNEARNLVRSTRETDPSRNTRENFGTDVLKNEAQNLQRNSRDLSHEKAVYGLGEGFSVEVPLTTNVHESETGGDIITKRDVLSKHVGYNEDRLGAHVFTEDKTKQGAEDKTKSDSSETKVNSGTRRDLVPGLLRDNLEDEGDDNFRVRDKSADLEIHADSDGVRVKAKPASLQVVSNPHGSVKTLPGETHLHGMNAERRTFTPLLPTVEKRHHRRQPRHPMFHAFRRHHRFPRLPFLRRRHFHHRRHMRHPLPWLRHRQSISYPDIFERMRNQGGPSLGGGPFTPSFGMTPPFSGFDGPMSSMMRPPAMMPAGGPSMMPGGGGMNGPMIPQLLQRSPPMESSPTNRFGVPDGPMGGGEGPGMGGGMGPMGPMAPMMSGFSPMSGMSPVMSQGPGQMGGKPNALEFWGMPNQDQLKALARGENVRKVLGSNHYGESLGGIMGGGGMMGGGGIMGGGGMVGGGAGMMSEGGPMGMGGGMRGGLGGGMSELASRSMGGMGMNMPEGMNPGMSGGSFNANGLGPAGPMMGGGGTSSGMFGGGSPSGGGGQGGLFKKDDINKTDAYKKAMEAKKGKKSQNDDGATKKPTGPDASEKEFGTKIMNKAKSMVAGGNHAARDEHASLVREHRIRKSSISIAHEDEKRSLHEEHSSKKHNTKKIEEKPKHVKGTKKDVAVQRPPIIYHPPPEVYHRPDVVVHRAPVLFHRPPIVYHQAPVVIHRPAVVYRQPPIIFHQPSPMVSQPYLRAFDSYVTRPVMTNVGSSVASAYNYVGLPPEMMGSRKGDVPTKPEHPKKKSGKKNEKSKKESKRGTIPEESKYKKENLDTHVPKKKKKDVVVNRPPIIYHPPPEVYHRPQIVVHRAPLLIRRPPIVYHQPAVIVHRPPVVYHQPPIVFHQPPPTVSQPVLYSHDNFVVHPSYFASHRGSVVSDAGHLLGVPNTVSVPDTGGFPFQPAGVHPGGLGPAGFGPGGFGPGGIGPGGIGPGGIGAGGLGIMGPMAPLGRRKRSLKRKSGGKHESAKRKNAILVKRPPIVYHPPPEVYHRPDIVMHRAPIVIHRSPIVYHQPPVVVSRPSVVYHQPPVLFHQPPPMVQQPILTAHDTFTTQATLVPAPKGHTFLAVGKSGVPVKHGKSHKKQTATKTSHDLPEDLARKLASFCSNAGLHEVTVRQLVSIIKDRKVDELQAIAHDSSLTKLTMKQLRIIEDFLESKDLNSEKLLRFLSKPEVLKLSLNKLGETLTEEKNKGENATKKGEVSRAEKDKKASKKNAVLVKRPNIVYHPPPEVYHRPDIVVHRAPLVIHRAPIVYHQPPVVVHRPAVVYHQPPVLFHQPPPVVHQPVFTAHDTFHPTTSITHSGTSVTSSGTYIGVPTEVVGQTSGFSKSKVPSKKHKHHTIKERRSITKKDKTEKASKKNAVLVKRPPIIYHPPPEVYHRPDIVVHRAPIVIHRAPLVYHQAPVIVHRPAVVYHQPSIVFHQPPPVVHQPMFTSHDTFTTHNTLSLRGSSTIKAGDILGPPPNVLASRKTDVPEGKDVPGTQRNTIDKPQKNHHHKKEDKKSKPTRRSGLRKLLLSLQKDNHHIRKASGLQAVFATHNPLVLQRPPVFLQPRYPNMMFNQPMAAPYVQRVFTPVPVVQQVIRQVPVPVVYHHHHWPTNIHHHDYPVPVPVPVAHHTYHGYGYGNDYSFYGKSFVPKNTHKKTPKKETIDIHQYDVPVGPGHVSKSGAHSHVANHHSFVTRHAGCPSNCVSCQPHCPSSCPPHCVAIIHHQHHRPQHIFVNHDHQHHIANTHFHNHHWPVHHHNVHHGLPYVPHRHIGQHYPYKRDIIEDLLTKRATVPHYRVYQHVQHWHPPCNHHNHLCHHHHHSGTVHHSHYHPATLLHHHHYHPYPVYLQHEHIRPVIYHHIKPYPVHHNHEHYIHDTVHHTDHHDHYHPVPVRITQPPVMYPVPVPVPQPYPFYNTPLMGRSAIPKTSKHTKKSKEHEEKAGEATDKSEKRSGVSKKSNGKKDAKKKKDVVVNRPPIIYHPPPEVYHRPEIVVHRAPVLIHRPPIVYHQSSVIVHRPAVVYHQAPIVFHQPAPTVSQPVLYSHDNFVMHPTFMATHAGTMVESAGHYLGLPSGPIDNFPSMPYGPMMGGGFNPGGFQAPYATPLGRRRRSTTKSDSKKPRRKNSIVVHRPPVIFHPPPEIYHRPSVVVHRPDVLIHRPPIVYHQSPVVLHRPPVVYHQTPIVFHQPPPMVNQPVFNSHDMYVPHPVYSHYDSSVHHAGGFYGVPHYGYHDFGGFHGGFGGFHGGFGGFHGGFGVGHGFGGIGAGFGRSDVSKPGSKQTKANDEHAKKDRVRRDDRHAKTTHKKKAKSEQAHNRNSVVVHRPPVIFHPPPEVLHRAPYVLHQPDIVIHRPPVVYHQAPVVVHRPAVAYHQPPVIYHQHHVVVQPTLHHHQYFGVSHCLHGGCLGGGFGCFGGGPGCFGHGHGFNTFHGGYPYLFGKSGVSKPKHTKHKKHAKHTKGTKKHDIVIHRPPLVYHPPPEIYHRPDIVVHRPDVLVHRPSVVYDQPSVVLHRPAVVYREPPVVFHQPPPMVHLPVFHAQDAYEPHPEYHSVGSQMEYDHNIEGVPPYYRPDYGHAYYKSTIANNSKKHLKKHSKKHGKEHKKSKTHTSKAHKKYHLIVHRPSLIYHPSPAIYHRPDVVVHRPDIVIHRPSVMVHPPPVLVHKPAVVYHEPPVVFHEPLPAVHQPLYHSVDTYAPHPVLTQVGSQLTHGGAYVGYSGHHHVGDYYGVSHHGGYNGDGFHGYGSIGLTGFGKSKILKSKSKTAKSKKKDDPEKVGKKHVVREESEKHDKTDSNAKNKRDMVTKTKRVQFPKTQHEKTETGTKKNSIVVRRPPIIYHPPPEVYHRPDIVVHRAPIVIQRPPLVYHQAPVIVHRPAVVYHQPNVVFHQPPPTVHQPVYHSIDNFNLHPHMRYSQAASSVEQVGNYIGVPQEVIHRSQISGDGTKPTSAKQRRSATLEPNITPVTPLNFFHPNQASFEQPRSTIPYPTLNALHPYSASYSSYPGFSTRHKRYLQGSPITGLPFAPPAAFAPHPLMHPHPFPYPGLKRPTVNVNVETVKSQVPGKVPRSRRQIPVTLDPLHENSALLGPPFPHPGTPYDQRPPFPARPQVNVNVETVKSAVPKSEGRSRRQIVAGVPTAPAQPSLAAQPVYAQAAPTYVPVATAQGPPQQAPDETLGVYKDLIHALYGGPRATKVNRPRVNIVVQSAKSRIPHPEGNTFRKSAMPQSPSLQKDNVDAFNTMPEVTTIEPPLLRDGVRVNMVELGDPTAGDSASSSNRPQFGGTTNNQEPQGDFMTPKELDIWKKSQLASTRNVESQRKSGVPVPSIAWQDQNAEKNSAVPTHAASAKKGKKRYMVGGFQEGTPYEQGPSLQTQAPVGSIATAVPVMQGAPEGANYEPATSFSNGVPHPERPHINVNVETVKDVLPNTPSQSNAETARKRQLSTAPMPALLQPNPNNLRSAALKSVIAKAKQATVVQNQARPTSKRQQILRRLPYRFMPVMGQPRHSVTPARTTSRVKPARQYPSFSVQDTATRGAAAAPRILNQGPVAMLSPRPQQVPVGATPVESLAPPLAPPLAIPAEPANIMPPVAMAPPMLPWTSGRRPRVNVNIETIKSRIPSGSKNKIITPRFKREYPVLYNVIKAKARLAQEERKKKTTKRGKRQIPFFVDQSFFDRLIPDPGELEKRAFFGAVPRYVPQLFPRRFRRPRKMPLSNGGSIEIGGTRGMAPSGVASAANFLKNEFSQNFQDIAKIQRQEVNDIKGMSTMPYQAPQPSLSSPEPTQEAMPAQQDALPAQQDVLPAQQDAVPAAAAPAISAFQQQPQQLQLPQPIEIPAQQAPQLLSAATQPAQMGPAAVQQAPAQLVSQPVEEQPAEKSKAGMFQPQFITAPVPAADPESSPKAEIPLAGGLLQGAPGFAGFPFPAFLPAPMPDLAQFPGSIPHPPENGNDYVDRPSVNIQVQTSKSKIPNVEKKDVKKKPSKKTKEKKPE